nr:MAG TPA: hypothetical protein [Caudoviricetes sp.]
MKSGKKPEKMKILAYSAKTFEKFLAFRLEI